MTYIEDRGCLVITAAVIKHGRHIDLLQTGVMSYGGYGGISAAAFLILQDLVPFGALSYFCPYNQPFLKHTAHYTLSLTHTVNCQDQFSSISSVNQSRICFC